MSSAPAPSSRRSGAGTAGFWVGGLMLLLAGAVLTVFVVNLLTIATTRADAIVAADDRPHLLDLPPGEERMLFRRDGHTAPDCMVAPPGGAGRAPEELRLAVRTDADGGTWHAFARFATGDGRVVLRCSSGPPLEVRVGVPVGLQDVFGPGGLLVLAPAVLGLGGLVLVVLSALRRSSTPRPGRPGVS